MALHHVLLTNLPNKLTILTLVNITLVDSVKTLSLPTATVGSIPCSLNVITSIDILWGRVLRVVLAPRIACQRLLSN